MQRTFLLLTKVLAMVVPIAGMSACGRFEPDRDRYPLRGLDVSHHQGAIDWAQVAGDDVAFAYMKATEGGDWRDTRFQTNWAEARAQGLAVGAYHFFTLCRPGADQARNYIEVVPNQPGTLPPAVDLEYVGNCPERPEPEELGRELDAFVNAVEAHYGRPVVLYVQDIFEAAYAAVLPERLRWVRSIREPIRADRWLLWQYDDEGRVAGITTPVDLNVFNADRTALDALLFTVAEN